MSGGGSGAGGGSWSSGGGGGTLLEEATRKPHPATVGTGATGHTLCVVTLYWMVYSIADFYLINIMVSNNVYSLDITRIITLCD